MPELTDDQLDGLFRKSVEELDTPFDPAAWQDMKARLDANDRTTPGGALIWKNLLRWGLPVALLLLLTGGGWFVYHKAKSGTTTVSSQKTVRPRSELTLAKGESEAETPQLANPDRPASSPERKTNEGGQLANRAESVNESASPETSVEKTGIKLAKSTGSKSGKVPEINRLPATVDVEPSPKESLAKTKLSDATKSVSAPYRLADGKKRINRPRFSTESVTTASAGRAESRLKGVSVSQRRESVVKFRRQRTTGRDLAAMSVSGYALSTAPSSGKPPVTTRQETPNPDYASNNSSLPESNEASSVRLPAVNELAIRPAHWPKSLVFTGRPVEAHPDTTAQRVVPKPPVQRGLSVRLAVAPDLSTVGLKNFSRPGTNVGLFLEYRLAKRWSIQVGVIQSTKVYRALSGEYGYLPPDIEKYKANLAEVAGRCNMLDIPINLRYDVVVKPRKDGLQPTRWFISSGVTSYIMKQEDYTYTYYHYYANNRTDWSNPSPDRYRLSNLNLSIGYERSFSRRLSWQVEPFMKVPLKGVGVYKIDLLSTGAFFSLRYKL
ncbi:hypothetical protein GO730_21190 [Spirosoma sp. HMF3257]|uniref:PorT family protein n=1 Tax=Spirosoma telluris TaxID=2183553 RepID=A0A327NL02_9BACT|nr:hypothetical protein [Spirosoma telluris]RAI76060.1 hypothetical protein HMF3257_21115 [Spirosoma telluris]